MESNDDYLKFINEKAEIFNQELKETGCISYFAIIWVKDQAELLADRIDSLRSRKEHMEKTGAKELRRLFLTEQQYLVASLGADAVNAMLPMSVVSTKLREELARLNRELEQLENALIVVGQMQETIKQKETA